MYWEYGSDVLAYISVIIMLILATYFAMSLDVSVAEAVPALP